MGHGKTSRSLGMLSKAAGPLMGFSKARPKPTDTFEGRRAPCRCQQSPAGAVGDWKAAGPLVGFGKAQQKPQGTSFMMPRKTFLGYHSTLSSL